MDALPVVVATSPDLAGEVRAFVEGHCAWQVVHAADGLPPALALAERVVAGIPTIVLVRTPDAEAVRSALLAGAVDVVEWPAQRDRLPHVATRLVDPRAGRAAPVLRVTGAAGGVGTSTVALAVAGLAAWRGTPTVVVGQRDLLRLCGVDGPAAAAPPDIEGFGVAAEVPGVPGLRVLHGRLPLTGAGATGGVVVADEGVGGTTGILVGRPDRALVEALVDPARWRAVVVVGDGALPLRAVHRLGRGTRLVRLPWSARVARAGLRGRVPAGLPGTTLELLRPLLRRSGAAA